MMEFFISEIHPKESPANCRSMMTVDVLNKNPLAVGTGEGSAE
jgi:hypothetical protein